MEQAAHEAAELLKTETFRTLVAELPGVPEELPEDGVEDWLTSMPPFN